MHTSQEHFTTIVNAVFQRGEGANTALWEIGKVEDDLQ